MRLRLGGLANFQPGHPIKTDSLASWKRTVAGTTLRTRTTRKQQILSTSVWNKHSASSAANTSDT
jgi:hypothetical protein